MWHPGRSATAPAKTRFWVGGLALLSGAGIGALFIQTEGELWSSPPHTCGCLGRQARRPPLVGDQGAAAPRRRASGGDRPLEVEDTISRYLTGPAPEPPVASSFTIKHSPEFSALVAALPEQARAELGDEYRTLARGPLPGQSLLAVEPYSAVRTQRVHLPCHITGARATSR